MSGCCRGWFWCAAKEIFFPPWRIISPGRRRFAFPTTPWPSRPFPPWNKPGKLTAPEFEQMKMHTLVGAQILGRVAFHYPVVPIVRHHHERWDGCGYPDGLKGEDIPLTARILTVVDCFDALREDRQYRRGLTDRKSVV